MNAQEAIDKWYRFKQTIWAQETSRVNSHITELWIQLIGDKDIGSLTPLDVQSLYLHLVEKEYTPFWINNHRAKFHAFISWCIESQLLDRQIVNKTTWPILRQSVEYPEILLDHEKEEELINALPPQWRRPVGSYIRLCLVTALRMRAIYSLRKEHLSQDGWLSIPEDIIKNRQHLKFPLYLFPHVFSSLQGGLDTSCHLLLSGLPSFAYLNILLHDTADRVGLDKASFTSTSLRRIALDRFLKVCPDLDAAKRYFGWKTTKVMEDHYRFKLGDRNRIELASKLASGSLTSIPKSTLDMTTT